VDELDAADVCGGSGWTGEGSTGADDELLASETDEDEAAGSDEEPAGLSTGVGSACVGVGSAELDELLLETLF
jgi:hypothetical protein